MPRDTLFERPDHVADEQPEDDRAEDVDGDEPQQCGGRAEASHDPTRPVDRWGPENMPPLCVPPENEGVGPGRPGLTNAADINIPVIRGVTHTGQ